MKPYKYQEDLSKEAYSILKKHGIVYLAMEERTGKTLTSVLVCESMDIQKVLVITKKKALTGWHETLEKFSHTKEYTVTNYHQVSKITEDYDVVILDESHNYISSYPKPSKMYKDILKVTLSRPLIYLSATPYAQGTQLLYHQFKLSSCSPWRNYKNFYGWFKVYGIPTQIKINGILINSYKKVKTEAVLSDVQHLFITKTREELGFTVEPTDRLHYIELEPDTRKNYNTLIKHNMIQYSSYPFEPLVADTPMKLRTSLHMMEGGVAKIKNDYIVLDNIEKIRYIVDLWGDSKDVVIMHNYIAEGMKLKKYFNEATILQATSFAEGVDLSSYKHLIIYSQDFSTARHTQRRARQTNKNRTQDITVHYLLVKKAVSEQVYKTVTMNKTNFVDSVFERELL